MYSTRELIIKSAQRAILHRLFSETMSDITQKSIAIHDASNTNLAELLEHLGENDVLVTNDNYVYEQCDYQVINKEGKIILTVNSDGTVINDLDQYEYLDDSTCELISRVYDNIKKSDNVYIVTEAA